MKIVSQHDVAFKEDPADRLTKELALTDLKYQGDIIYFKNQDDKSSSLDFLPFTSTTICYLFLYISNFSSPKYYLQIFLVLVQEVSKHW